jgi:hypothetical protein
MKRINISPTTLFRNHINIIGEEKASIIFDNFTSAEKVVMRSLEQLNIKKLSMIVKVKNSQFSILYKYDSEKKA